MSYHEPRMPQGDSEGVAPVLVYVDDEGVSHQPGSAGYVEPSQESAEFLTDFAQSLLTQHQAQVQNRDAEAAGQLSAPPENVLDSRAVVDEQVAKLQSEPAPVQPQPVQP